LAFSVAVERPLR